MIDYQKICKEQELENIAQFIASFCRTWGRFGGQAKEKYGSVRFYPIFSLLSLHTLVYPGYMYIQFPRWLNNLDHHVFTPIAEFLLGKLYHKWQVSVYKKAYRRALAKWPQYTKEILFCADYPEYIGITYGRGEHANR